MTELNGHIEWLERWYQSQCNGEWERQYGIHIRTVDNPGWFITINLTGTAYQNFSFNNIKIEQNDNDWFFCILRDANFEASGSPFNLSIIIGIFRSWIENCQKNRQIVNKFDPDYEYHDPKKQLHIDSWTLNELMWLQKWYFSQCDGDWEHIYGINIQTINKPGWLLSIEIEQTELETKPFNTISADISGDDWMNCYLEKNIFHGCSSPRNLSKMLRIFREWSEK